jgi:hypothetical protein
MIPRLLVPVKLSPPAVEAEPSTRRRRPSVLDERMVIPATLPIVQLDGRSAIPSHVPLGVLGERLLVPRESVAGTLELPLKTESFPPSDLDERMAVPADAHPAKFLAGEPVPFGQFEELLEPDIFTTGEVHFLPRPVEEGPKKTSWLGTYGSIAFHSALVLMVVFSGTLFPQRSPTQSEMEIARRNLGVVYLPNTIFSEPKASPPPGAPGPQMRVDPRMLREVVPSRPESLPAPVEREAPRASRELPSAPVPSTSSPPSIDRSNEPSRGEMRIEPVKPLPEAPSKLTLPKLSPGKALEESVRGAGRGGSNTGTFGGPVPRGPGGLPGGGGGGGGGGQGYLGGGLQMLTPDEGVDFSDYLTRVLARVQQNWYSQIPESARLGEKGRVVLQFRIMRNGEVLSPEPNLLSSSGREPMDLAAMGSIRASNRFEPLPSAFSGPYIELRFTFLYNLPLNTP